MTTRLESRDFAIGVLSTTAVILLVGLIVVQSRPSPAFAGNMTTTNGDYVLTVGTLSIDNEEVVYVLDAPQERLAAYRFDAARRQINLVEGIDLKQMRAAAKAPQQPNTRGRRGRRP